MTLAQAAWDNGVLPSALAKAMGASRQFVERAGEHRLPTETTVRKACKGLERLGVKLLPYQLVGELSRR